MVVPDLHPAAVDSAAEAEVSAAEGPAQAGDPAARSTPTIV